MLELDGILEGLPMPVMPPCTIRIATFLPLISIHPSNCTVFPAYPTELDGILEGLPMPVMPPCTTRIAAMQRRVHALTSSLSRIHTRIETMKRDLRFRSTCREQQSDKTALAQASMKTAQGAVVFRTDDPRAGCDYRPPMPGDNPLAGSGGRASMKKAQGAVVFRTDDPLAGRDYRPAHDSTCFPPAPPSPLSSTAGGRASMKKAQGAVVFRTDDPLAGRDYRPPMPGDNPDFWEGSQWDLLGFVAEYLWVFGIVLASTWDLLGFVAEYLRVFGIVLAWDLLGFVAEYLWVFGIVLVAPCLHSDLLGFVAEYLWVFGIVLAVSAPDTLSLSSLWAVYAH
ncbi:unnamed protein product [Closterium sp. NIES-64]|nr:unnamed protein product [Closterium sp. NIES-64]